MSAIDVRGLSVVIDGVSRVRNVSLQVEQGEILAIVGESGAGKSLLLSALLGFAPGAADVSCDALTIAGEDLAGASDARWREVRGNKVGLISQDALRSLDPLRLVGAEVAETLDVHRLGDRASRSARAHEAMKEAALTDVEARAKQYPHELSGGLRQRALIAAALSADPRILLADEPTTALDATVQLRILTLLRQLADDQRAMVFVSHDLAAVARIADRIAVMREGEILEQGDAASVLAAPQHAYTKALIAASTLTVAPAVEPGADVLVASGISVNFGARAAVVDASLTVRRGETVGIVGESGSGKTTLANVLMGQLRPTSGSVTVEGRAWNPAPESARRPMRSRIQLVSQNPGASLNPRWTIRKSLAEALRVARIKVSDAAISELLSAVELPADVAGRRPPQLSGGQQQRAAIARALAVRPDILVLDEPLSALDVSVQATIIALLRTLQREHNLAMVFISHDLGVVASLAHRCIVMRDGHVVESGDTAVMFADPQHDFTRELLGASRAI